MTFIAWTLFLLSLAVWFTAAEAAGAIASPSPSRWT